MNDLGAYILNVLSDPRAGIKTQTLIDIKKTIEVILAGREGMVDSADSMFEPKNDGLLTENTNIKKTKINNKKLIKSGFFQS